MLFETYGKGETMKPDQVKVGMKVQTADNFSTQHYFVKQIVSKFLVALEYPLKNGVMASGGVIDISLIKKVK